MAGENVGKNPGPPFQSLHSYTSFCYSYGLFHHPYAVGTSFSLVGRSFSMVGTLFSLVGKSFYLVGTPFSLVGRSFYAVGTSFSLVGRSFSR
ncbi:MAG: hypothetical protein NT166_08075 [Candidatus Aminicenantes bacterium]|nr:hypothetical protein [Candidatus Aminicenantes bacterium]